MRQLLLTILAVLASGTMFLLALPPADFGCLVWVAFVPVIVAIQGRGFARGFACGLGVLLVGMGLSRWGIFYAPSLIDGDAGWNYLGFAIFGFAVALQCGVLGETKEITPRKLFVLAAWAVIFESVLLIYLPAHVALTQYRNVFALMLSSWISIWGISFLIWLVNLLIGYAILKRDRKPALLGMAIIVAFVVASFIPQHAETGSLRVAAIQTEFGEPESLRDWNAEAGAQGAEVVVWPELSGIAGAPQGKTDEWVALAMQPGQPAFVTSFEDGAKPMPHNTAAIFSKDGESARYHKRKPFGSESKIHAAGTEAVAAEFGGRAIGLNICFDSCFPFVMRETALLNGVGFIALPTQDPPAPFGSVQAVHAAYTPFRSAELGVSIARADTTAFSLITDRYGNIVAETGVGEKQIIYGSVSTSKRWTLVTLWGDYFLYLCILGAALNFVLSRRRQARAAS